MVDSLIPGIFGQQQQPQQQSQPQQASQQYSPSPYGMAAQMLSPLAGTNNSNNFIRQIAMAKALQNQQQGNQQWNNLNTLNQTGGAITDANGNPIGPAASGSYGGGTPLAGLNPPTGGSGGGTGSSGGVWNSGTAPTPYSNTFPGGGNISPPSNTGGMMGLAQTQYPSVGGPLAQAAPGSMAPQDISTAALFGAL